MVDYLETLERLGKLREQGVLTDSEFEAEKSRILGSGTTDHGQNAQDRSWRKISRGKLAAAAVVAILLSTAAYLGISAASEAAKYKEPAAPDVTSPSSGSSSTVRISSLLKFDRPGECAPADDLKVVFNDLRALNPGEREDAITLDGRLPAQRPNVQVQPMKSGGNAVIADLPVKGAWDGLRVIGIRTAKFENSDLYSTQIRFSDDAEKVRRVLNDQGFELGKVGELKNVELDDKDVVMGIEGLRHGGALTCLFT